MGTNELNEFEAYISLYIRSGICLSSYYYYYKGHKLGLSLYKYAIHAVKNPGDSTNEEV